MKSKSGIILIISLIGLLALLLVLPANPVSAQNETCLAISPEESTVPLGNQVVLELLVTVGESINAYDLTLSYDPAIILLTDWEHGDYLSGLAVVKEENTPGTFRLAATQLAQPEVSGDGVLLILTFETRVEGDSLVELVDAVFADSQGGSVEPELVSGWVYVSLLPTFTPTPEESKETTPAATQTSPTISEVWEASSTPQPTSGSTGGGEEIEEVTPASQTEESYPVESDLVEQDFIGDAQGGAGYPAEDQNSESNPSDAYTEPEMQANESLAEQQESGLNRLLWGVLIVSVFALGFIMVNLIRRKNRKEEDLLL